MRGTSILNKICIVVGVLLLSVILITLFSKKSIEINETMNDYLQEIGINDYEVYKIDDYKDISFKKVDYEISEQDIQQYIEDDLEAREENIEVEDRNYVKNGDVVSVTYTVYLNEQQVNYVENDVFMVGKGKYNTQIEDNIVGKKKNKKITFEIQVPKDDENVDFAGKTEKVELIVNSISVVKSYELNTGFITKFYNFDTMEEYYDYVKEALESKNEYESETIENDEIMSKLIDCFQYELSNDEVAEYSISIINEYSEIASLYDKSLEEYREQELGMTEDEFMEFCYNEGEKRIKEYIAIGVISKLEGISVNKEDADLEAAVSKLINDTMEFFKENYLMSEIEEK